MARKLHPLRVWMQQQEPPLSYRKASDKLGCDKMTLHEICTRVRCPRPVLARRIVAWTKGAVTLEHLYGGK